ncbi:MAG: hypothetical protein LBD06_13105 [Candidatus Accumulibacter sp.]|jgi:hypothetical protein|nr:hypothetical protein [Accumulibacter sp.]
MKSSQNVFARAALVDGGFIYALKRPSAKLFAFPPPPPGRFPAQPQKACGLPPIAIAGSRDNIRRLALGRRFASLVKSVLADGNFAMPSCSFRMRERLTGRHVKDNGFKVFGRAMEKNDSKRMGAEGAFTNVMAMRDIACEVDETS